MGRNMNAAKWISYYCDVDYRSICTASGYDKANSINTKIVERGNDSYVTNEINQKECQIVFTPEGSESFIGREFKIFVGYSNTQESPMEIYLNDKLINPKALGSNTDDVVIYETVGYVTVSQIKNTFKFISSNTAPKINCVGIAMHPRREDTVIWDLNLPGTHDSAAINKTKIPTPYACHYWTLTEQLMHGIRLLDLRLSVSKNTDGQYVFTTCHGDFGPNEYQSFESAMKECVDFLKVNSMEFIAMSLKIDDYNGYDIEKDLVLDALHNFLSADWLTNRIYDSNAILLEKPTLKKVFGKIYLLNRIDDGLRFGLPIKWTDNTSGEKIEFPIEGSKLQKYYVQDKYENYSDNSNVEKTQLFENAIEAFNSNRNEIQLLLNFGTGTHLYCPTVDVKLLYLQHCGKLISIERPKCLGWSLYNFEDEHYVTTNENGRDADDCFIWSYIISSNFEYSGYHDKFVIPT